MGGRSFFRQDHSRSTGLPLDAPLPPIADGVPS